MDPTILASLPQFASMLGKGGGGTKVSTSVNNSSSSQLTANINPVIALQTGSQLTPNIGTSQSPYNSTPSSGSASANDTPSSTGGYSPPWFGAGSALPLSQQGQQDLGLGLFDGLDMPMILLGLGLVAGLYFMTAK